MSRIQLEVIATSAEDAQTAEAAGADRIELISAQSEGGLTPSLGMIEEVTESVSIPVHVMIRPHSYQFCYSSSELRSMIRDIGHIKNTRTASLVLGVLDQKQQIDQAALERLLEAASELPVTFHRAFDEVQDMQQAIDILGQYDQIQRILTSGGCPSVLQAIDHWPQLQMKAEVQQITLLAGAGLTLDTLADFVRRTGVREVHLGSAVRQNGDITKPLDPARIRQARQLLNTIV